MNIDSWSVRGVASNGEGKNENGKGETGRKGKKSMFFYKAAGVGSRPVCSAYGLKSHQGLSL